jgi:hypothetical protein
LLPPLFSLRQAWRCDVVLLQSEVCMRPLRKVKKEAMLPTAVAGATSSRWGCYPRQTLVLQGANGVATNGVRHCTRS